MGPVSSSIIHFYPGPTHCIASFINSLGIQTCFVKWHAVRLLSYEYLAVLYDLDHNMVRGTYNVYS